MTIKLANRLAELRKAHGYSQEELAEKLGVSRQAVSKWECAEASPDTDNLIELAKIYNTSLDELLEIRKVEDNKETIKVEKSNDSKTLKIEIHDHDDDDDDIDEHEDEEDRCQHEHHSRKPRLAEIVIDTTSGTLVLVAYLLLGVFYDLWGKAWVLFFLFPVISSVLDAIYSRDANKFIYPVFIAGLYLFLCVWVPGDLWHPLWVLFLTIPLYYSIVAGIKKAISYKKGN